MEEKEISPEERYFRERESQVRNEMREKMEKKAAEASEKGRIAAILGGGHQALVDRLYQLGISAEAARALHLLPLVEVAWADGTVSAGERKEITRLLHERGIEPGSEAATFITALLEKKPSQNLLDQMHAVLRDLLEAKGLKPQSIVEACEHVAQASGGFLGFGDPISDDERKVIEQVTAKLSQSAVKKAQAGLA